MSLVCLDLTAPSAHVVCVAGSFNDWQPNITSMMAVGDGKWRKELTLATGRYEYRFVVDGLWVSDPNNPKSVTNPFGETNSVLLVGG